MLSFPTSDLPGSSQLQYVEAFDSEFTLLLSERRSTSLADMMKDAIEVEVNLAASRNKKRDEGEWRREEGDIMRDKEPEQPSSSNSQEVKMEMMMKSMEKLIERLTMDNRPPTKENQEQQNRNQNVRRSQVLQTDRESKEILLINLSGPRFRRIMWRKIMKINLKDEIHHLDTESSSTFLMK